ncbi:Zinc finger protein [Oopsacas minuta]|uniref:Zinc finger protein n=1 Tax=Oopsacas minuta TaxID=111878 RepID=A0AAV7JCR8_9METZ|nr:Zinc finger protein [Oopsacas minuta]
MATKKFVMEIPLILHDMVQEFVVSALKARPSNYVDFAVEYYMHLQSKEDRVLYETVRVNSIFRSSEDSDEICGDGEVVSDTANVYQVSIHPEAFHSPPNKYFPSDDEDSHLTDLPCSNRAVPTKTNSPTILNSNNIVKSDNNSHVINSSHTLPTSPPFTFLGQDSLLNVTSSTNSSNILPMSSPVLNTSIPNLPINFTLQSSIALTTNSQHSTPNNTPTTTLNSPMSVHVVGEGNSPHSSPFTPPLKNNFSNLSLTSEYMHPHTPNKNHFQCKSCRGVFKPHPRPNTQAFLSLPNSLIDPSSNSVQSLPDRPQVYSILPTSHIQQTDASNSASSPPTYFATASQPTLNSKNTTTDLSERKFHCSICERSYKSNTGLKRHLIVHSGERPFQCHYCFKSFYRKYVLTTHISRVHNKIIPSSQS